MSDTPSWVYKNNLDKVYPILSKISNKLHDMTHECAMVSGFPIHLTGWNTAWSYGKLTGLTRSVDNWSYIRIQDDIYRQKPYTLWGFIPIIGVTIRKDRVNNNIWRIWRDGDDHYFQGYYLTIDDNVITITCGESIQFVVHGEY